ncbi:MAG: hypothetical protein K6A63_08225, partial [Acholeplasmatales bacterium]|nr:hypothetical protein [Acholeplasmatales bacterium]
VIEFESTIIEKYDVDPKIFYDINFYQYTSGYYFECRASDEYKSKLGEKPINLKIEAFFKDGTSIAKTNDGGLIDGELISLEAALSEDESKTIDDVKSFEISIIYDDKVIYKSNVNPLNELTVSSADVDDDGNVVIPFEINLEDAEDISFEAYVSENEAQVEFDNNSGNIIIKEINSNIVNISLLVSYVKDGITNNASLVLEEVNLGADYEVSYFISHSGSYYSYFNIRFDASINGKNVNIDLTPEVTEDGNTASEESYNKYLDYYCYSYSSNVTYKVTNEGFNNTEVTITPNIGIGDPENAKYDSNINNYSYGYYDSANDEYYAYYNKSLNSDGTVNYYFDVPFKENSTGHYLRIEGSYVLDGVTKYIHSDLLTSDFKLENLKNYDYNFVIRGYYLKDDVLYDTELGYNKYYLNTRIISDILSGSQTFLGSLASTNDTNDVVLDLTLNPLYFDTKNGLVLNYLNKNYQIDILESGSNSLVVKEYGNYTGIGYDFSNSEYGYSYIYYDEDDNGNYQKLKVEFYLINEGDKDLDLNSTVTYYVKDALAGGDAIKSTVNIIENTISYDKDKVEVEVEEMTSLNRIIVKAPDYTSSNSIYKLYAVAYYNGKEITRESMSSGQASLFIDKGYSDLEIKLEEALDQKAEPLNYDTGDSDFKIVLGSDSVDATIPSAEAKISTIEVINPDNGDTYNVTITADNFDDYYIEAVVNYTDSNGNIISNTFTGEKGSTSLVFERDTNYTLDNIEVHIKDDYNVLNSVIVPATVTLGEADVDEKIVIPYEINVPNVVALEGDSTVTLGDNNVSIDALKGSFEIDNITTKENAVQFDITYIKDGILVSARIVKNYVFEVDFDYDIELGIYSDSSYDYYNDGNLSIECGNNDSQITYYFYRADIIVDAYFKGYKLSGFTDYVVNITSGGMVSAADGGYVCASKTSGYSLTGSEGTNRILMLHYVTIENNVITSIDKVELEFNIDGGESHLFTYDIPQYETSDAIFSIDKSNSFDWVTTVDGTNTLTFDTGFDSTANPNYVYKVFVYNSDEEILSESNLLAKSADYETGSNITFTGLPESNYGYHVMVKGYYKFGDTIIDISNKLYVEIENVHATYSYSSEIYPYYSGKEGVVKISTNALLSDAVITYTINPGDSTNTATDTINLSELTTETRNYINDYIQVYIEDDSDEGYIFIKFMVSSKNYNNYLTSAEISVENKIGETKTVTI